jgi:hypothetical protein
VSNHQGECKFETVNVHTYENGKLTITTETRCRKCERAKKGY